MTGADEELQAKLKALQDKFKAGLNARLNEIDSTIDNLRTGGDGSAEELDTLLGLAHKLTGSAGTFGLPAVSDAARELEALCETLVKEDKDASTEMERITELASNLRKAGEKKSG